MRLSGYRLVLISFNPRARVGRDEVDLMNHTRHIGFNPRARVGRDARFRPRQLVSFRFQSTRPRRARRLY